MGFFVSNRMVDAMESKGIEIKGSKILIAGLSFKENCNDLRNTRVIDIVLQLKSLDINVDIFDPWVSKQEALSEYNLDLIEEVQSNEYEGIIIAVAHDKFRDFGSRFFRDLGKFNHVLFDLKGLFNLEESDLRL